MSGELLGRITFSHTGGGGSRVKMEEEEEKEGGRRCGESDDVNRVVLPAVKFIVFVFFFYLFRFLFHCCSI